MTSNQTLPKGNYSYVTSDISHKFGGNALDMQGTEGCCNDDRIWYRICGPTHRTGRVFRCFPVKKRVVFPMYMSRCIRKMWLPLVPSIVWL